MNLIEQINTLDYLYERSDDHELYLREQPKKENIEFHLNKLNEEELLEIEKQLDIVGKHNWKRYFKKKLYELKN